MYSNSNTNVNTTNVNTNVRTNQSNTNKSNTNQPDSRAKPERNESCRRAFPFVKSANIKKQLEVFEQTPYEELQTDEFLNEYLDIKNPFKLNPRVYDIDTLRLVSDCIWESYYLPHLKNKNQNKIRKKFDTFLESFSNRKLDENTAKEILTRCNKITSPTDVFKSCADNCVGTPGSKNTTPYPETMMKELTLFNTEASNFMFILNEYLKGVSDELVSELKKRNVDERIIARIIHNKFGTQTYVPPNPYQKQPKVATPLTPAIQAQRLKEKTKKERQRLQTRLLKKVMSNGKVKPKYNSFFALPTQKIELPKRSSVKMIQSTGNLTTDYNRTQKHITSELRFNPRKPLKTITNDLQRLQNNLEKAPKNEKNNIQKKINLTTKTRQKIQNLSDNPSTYNPLKLRVGTGGNVTVQKGGDRRTSRDVIELFSIQEFKSSGSQKYKFTNETVKKLTQAFVNKNTNINTKKITEITEKIEELINDNKEFTKKNINTTVLTVFLSWLAQKLSTLKQNDKFSIGQFFKYERIDIPFVKSYKLHTPNKIFNFMRTEKSDEFKFINAQNTLPELKSLNSTNELTYKIDEQFVNYPIAINAAKQRLIQNPQNILKNQNIARFFLRVEDEGRMGPIKNILNFLENYNRRNIPGGK